MRAAQLTFRVGEKTLVDAVDFTMHRGEVIAVIGPNGAGKSTLLKMLSGDLAPSAGAVFIDEKPLSAFARWEIAQRRAILPQSSAVPFDFTAGEVVEMGRLPHPVHPANAQIVDLALERTGTRHLRQRIVSTLSGGEMQRIHLARVLTQIWEPPSHGSRWLLLDEPTSSLDLPHQHTTLRIAREFSREGAGVLVVLHDLNLAAQYADRLLLLQNGRCIALASPRAVLTPERIRQVYGVDVFLQTHPEKGHPLVIVR